MQSKSTMPVFEKEPKRTEGRRTFAGIMRTERKEAGKSGKYEGRWNVRSKTEEGDITGVRRGGSRETWWRTSGEEENKETK